MWLLVLALVGCGDGGSEVGSAATVSIVEEVYSCAAARDGVIIPGIGQTLYTVEVCNEAFCYAADSETGHVELTGRVIDEASSGGYAIDTFVVGCDSGMTEVRIRYLAIE
jgi:hypothetical protein